MTSFTSRSDGTVLTIYLTEKIVDDLAAGRIQDGLIRMLSRVRERTVVIDFRSVEFLSSSALGMLLYVHKKCTDLNIAMRLCNIGEGIEPLFRITGLNKVLDMIHASPGDIPAPPGDPPAEAGIFARLKPRPSGGSAARHPDRGKQ